MRGVLMFNGSATSLKRNRRLNGLSGAVVGISVCLIACCSVAAQSNWAVAADAHGVLYFCDSQRDYLWRYEPEGRLQMLFDHNHCHSLTLGYDGNLYGENVGGESRGGGLVGVWRLTPEGERTFLLPLTTKPDPAVWLVRDAVGNGYAWDGNPEVKEVSRILKHTPEGETHTLAGASWGFADGPGPTARFGQIAAMTARPDGTLYVVDEGNLREISIDGTVSTVARGIGSNVAGGLPHLGGLYNHHMGAAVDSRGRVYVVDYGRRQIIRWDSSAGVHTMYVSGGIANWLSQGSWGLRPTGVAIVGDMVYVMEDWALPRFAANLIGNPQIRQISANGKSLSVLAVSSTTDRIVLVVGLAALLTAVLVHRKTRSIRPTRSDGSTTQN